MKASTAAKKGLFFLLVAAIVLYAVFPFYYAILSSLKSGTELFRADLFPVSWNFDNYVSAWTTLLPGDVLVTGTPGGVGARRNPPVWMKPGDKVEIEIDKVGVLENSIADG